MTESLFLDTLLDVVEACDRVLAPHGSLCFELGDTYAGSQGAGAGGLRAICIARGIPWCDKHRCDAADCFRRHRSIGIACPWCGELLYGGAGPDGLCINGHEWWDDDRA